MQWVLFTFPSRYWSTIGLWRVFSLGGWSRRIHTGFHVPRATQDTARLHDASCTGLSPATVALSRTFHSRQSCHIAVLQPRGSRNSPVLRCFSSRGSLPHLVRVTVRQTAGLPHSEIRGSRVACTYPRLIAACRVLRRLPEPRHPPYALSYFRRANCLAPLREQLAHAFSLPLAWTASRIRFYLSTRLFCSGSSINHAMPPFHRIVSGAHESEPISLSVPTCQRPSR